MRAQRFTALLAAGALMGGGIVRADGIVFHADLVPEDILNYLLEQYQTAADEQQQAQEAAKLDSQNATYQEFGAPAAPTLDPGSLPASSAALAPSVNNLQKAAASTPDPVLQGYINWSVANRAAIAALNQQVATMVAANNGQPLDYSHHVLLANQMGALRNKSLSLAMTDQNTVNEARIQYAAQKQQALVQERDEEILNLAQSQLDARLSR